MRTPAKVTFLKALLLVSAIVCLSCLSLLFIVTAKTVKSLPSIAEQTIHSEAEKTRVELRSLSLKIVGDVNQQLSSTRRDALQAVTDTRSDLVLEISSTRQMIDGQLSKTNQSIEEVAKLRQDIQPTIASVNKMAEPTVININSTLAATKVTMGQAAQTMKSVNLATPELLASLQRVTVNSDKTTEQTTKAMRNIAELTKPLPRWVRVPLQIFTPIAPIIF